MQPPNLENNELDQLGGQILRRAGLDFEEGKDFDWLTRGRLRYAGYAHYYVYACRNDSTMMNEADASIFNQLVGIDSKLGTQASIQLYGCLSLTTRWEIIKVRILTFH